MKTSAKIIILVVAVVLAVGAVLVFIKTQLAPPGNIRMNDPYAASLNAEVENVGSKPFPQCRDNFIKAYHKVGFMNQEEILNAAQADEMIVKIDTAYGNRIVEYAFGIFNSSSWPEESMSLIKNTMRDLRGDKLSDGRKALTPEMEGSFSEVDEVIDNYNKAWAFARNTSFRNVADASERIGRISNYYDLPYIGNNTALKAALERLPGAIANSHYNYVAGQVGRLGHYRNMSRNEFDNLSAEVKLKIDEYERTPIYRGIERKSASSLTQKASQLVDDAYDYYYSDY